MEIVLLIIVVVVLIGVFARARGTKNRPSLTSRRCPHCRQHIAMKASACPFCGHDVKPQRWIWE